MLKIMPWIVLIWHQQSDKEKTMAMKEKRENQKMR